MGGAFGSLDVYDYLTFAALLLLAIAFFSVAMFILGLPGKIAMRRNHPHAEAVKLMGWVGFLAVVPWIHALIWAYHDGVTVDIRGRSTERKTTSVSPNQQRQASLEKSEEPPTPGA